jgi:predicted amidohydrolase
MTKFELQQNLTAAVARAVAAETQCLVLSAQLEAERSVGRRNAAGAATFAANKAEYLRRTKAGESVVIVGHRVLTTAEHRASRAVH